LKGAVEAAAAGVSAEMSGAGATVECGTLPTIDADPFLLAWLLHELLANALRFRGEAPLRIRVFADADAISVSDNGTGIAAEFADRVFRPFKTLGGGGVGLGLTICRRIAEFHGGAIWVHPSNGGADIRFRFGAPVGSECA
jgi:signal transduction histidine kinase